MCDWPIYCVSDLEKDGLLLVQDGNHGEYRPQKYEFTDIGVAFIRAADLGLSAVQFDKAEKINEEAYNRIRKGIGKDFDTILSTKGTVGKLAFVPEGSPSYVCSPQTTFWRSLNPDVLDPKFLYYELQSKHFFNQISSRKGETDMADYLSLTAQRSLSIRVPDIEIQRDVVKVLSSVDDKIELNRQTNQTLEKIAQAIFKSWFVDFEPVKAKMAAKRAGASAEQIEQAAIRAISGKAPEQLAQLAQLDPQTLQQLKTTAALFPDALVDSELGEIPAGWEVSNLGAAITALRRGISPSYTEGKGVAVINQKCIRGHAINFALTRLNDPTKKSVNGRQVELGDVLINSTGVGTLGRLAAVRYLPELTVFDSHVTVVRADTTKITKSFLCGLMLEKETFIEASGAGTTGQTELNKQVLEYILFAKPSLELGVFYEEIAQPMNKMIGALEQQNVSLAELRDSLLPKLLSGEIKFSNSNEAA